MRAVNAVAPPAVGAVQDAAAAPPLAPPVRGDGEAGATESVGRLIAAQWRSSCLSARWLGIPKDVMEAYLERMRQQLDAIYAGH